MKTLVVEDSRVVRQYICQILEENDFEVLSTDNGLEAIQLSYDESPDVILMDLQLPGIDGLEAIRRIMKVSACPIVVLSGKLKASKDMDMNFEALQAGAVDVIAKPEGLGIQQQRFRDYLVKTLRLMAKVKVIHHRHKQNISQQAINESTDEKLDKVPFDAATAKLLAIGASTGGPALLYKILEGIPPAKVPVLISQHISCGFEEGLCSWLRMSGHDVEFVESETVMQQGKVYVSTAKGHMVLKETNVITVDDTTKSNNTPSIDLLFDSIAKFYHRNSCNIILSGMGSDGLVGMQSLRKKGNFIIAQSPETCVVASMPESVIDANIADAIMSPSEIITFLRNTIC